jgi:catechol 2,3-dioxygenase-like lactoylglutathione lyase family enzyme
VIVLSNGYHARSLIAGIALVAIIGGAEASGRSLSQFLKSDDTRPCYDRSAQPQTAVTDLHFHSQPFGGPSIPYPRQLEYFERTGVLFVLLYGIGQQLPYDSGCTYYLDCIGTPARPGIKNDFENAANYVEHPRNDIHVALSMSFSDLSKPEDIVRGIHLLDDEYPGLFQWMGELNLHKEALRGNHHVPATVDDIAEWKAFMAILRERGIPLALHADLGHDDNPTEHLHLMEEVLRRYPDNKIVWMHMGLSRELTTMEAGEHIALMSGFLDENPNLSLDISWTVIAEAYFDTAEKRALYVDFFNAYPTRILAGTDFVAAGNKTFEVYWNEATITGEILADLDDTAFRAIALGQNYFDLAPGLGDRFEAPPVCSR